MCIWSEKKKSKFYETCELNQIFIWTSRAPQAREKYGLCVDLEFLV